MHTDTMLTLENVWTDTHACAHKKKQKTARLQVLPCCYYNAKLTNIQVKSHKQVMHVTKSTCM